MTNTFMAKKDNIEKKWYLIDAADIPLGRLATQVAQILRGKHRPIYTPHVDTGDYVIIINAEKVKLTGKKWEQKEYFRHSGFIGGVKKVKYENLREKDPAFIIKKAIKGMLPKSRLGRKIYKKLKVYAGQEHPHLSQKPEVYELNFRRGAK